MNRQVIMHAVAFLLSLFCVTLNAQEIKFHYEDIRHGDIRYNYIVNDLGYFDKFHGEQNCRIHNGKNLESDFAITYDQGVPISFSIEARGIMPPFYTQGGLYSEGELACIPSELQASFFINDYCNIYNYILFLHCYIYVV